MERETGTQHPDLPHEFVERGEEASSANPTCMMCRQPRDAEIHQVEPERASEPTIPRERGS